MDNIENIFILRWLLLRNNNLVDLEGMGEIKK